MGIDKDLANDLIFALISLQIENVFLKSILSAQGAPRIEKALANAKTDPAIVLDVLRSFGPLIAGLTDADAPDLLVRKYVEMQTHLRPADDVN